VFLFLMSGTDHSLNEAVVSQYLGQKDRKE
jgi:hypothetical protein